MEIKTGLEIRGFGHDYLRGFRLGATRGGVGVGTDGEEGKDVMDAADGVDVDVDMIAIDEGTGDGGGGGGVVVMVCIA